MCNTQVSIPSSEDSIP